MRPDLAFEYAVKRLKNVEESQQTFREKIHKRIMEMMCIAEHEKQDNQEVCTNVQGRIEVLQDEKLSLTVRRNTVVQCSRLQTILFRRSWRRRSRLKATTNRAETCASRWKRRRAKWSDSSTPSSTCRRCSSTRCAKMPLWWPTWKCSNTELLFSK